MEVAKTIVKVAMMEIFGNYKDPHAFVITIIMKMVKPNANNAIIPGL